MRYQPSFPSKEPERWSQMNPAFAGADLEAEDSPALRVKWGPDDENSVGRRLSSSSARYGEDSGTRAYSSLPGSLWRTCCQPWLICPCPARSIGAAVEPMQIRLQGKLNERIRTYDDSVTTLTPILAAASREISRRASSKAVGLASPDRAPRDTNMLSADGKSMRYIRSPGGKWRPQESFKVYSLMETITDSDSSLNNADVPVAEGEGNVVPGEDCDYPTASSSDSREASEASGHLDEPRMKALEPDDGLPPGHAPVSQSIGSLAALWMSPEWLHCYALPELQDPLHQVRPSPADAPSVSKPAFALPRQ